MQGSRKGGNRPAWAIVFFSLSLPSLAQYSRSLFICLSISRFCCFLRCFGPSLQIDDEEANLVLAYTESATFKRNLPWTLTVRKMIKWSNCGVIWDWWCWSWSCSPSASWEDDDEGCVHTKRKPLTLVHISVQNIKCRLLTQQGTNKASNKLRVYAPFNTADRIRTRGESARSVEIFERA